ncbi:AP1-like protein [Cinnamomum micranthum f. kanehirae]|uniref:AP1-like protein n=1 Tax=Cinnamomum micranthum f. kanehirae TaxID=337451 RepID=A0A443Q4K1_9MAGN|nr:AP1-like protein [Cinnamomum micranthum f. kanehirae]
MGRGRVQLKRIENKINRQVTFSKAKGGPSQESERDLRSLMKAVIQRYERYSSFGTESDRTSLELNESGCLESRKLQTMADDLHINIRHMMGEDLDTLTTKQLEQIEQQLEDALQRIRSRKTQVMSDKIAALQKELHLRDTNMAHGTLQQQSSPFFLPIPFSSTGPQFGICQNREVGSEDESRGPPPGRTNSILPHWMLPRQQLQ